VPHIALLGAGFSRNWGGWLAPEAFEYLLGCPQVDEGLRHLLWLYKRRGGFEGALAQLQADFAQRRDAASEERLIKMQKAIMQMFADMDKAFAALGNFEPQNESRYLVRSLLVRFDAIFTLNQDLLLERHYLNQNVALSSYRKWNGWEIPGMRPVSGDGSQDPAGATWSPTDPQSFAVNGNLQPYFKLHGSSNWIDASRGRELVVMGGNKPSSIDQHPILKWNHEQFREYLLRRDTRVMIIGYSFGDEHINRAIEQASDAGNIRLFIIDPLGVEVADENRHHPIYSPGPLFAKLHPRLIGASRRTLRETFGTDRVEHGKVMRFFGSSQQGLAAEVT
jgi:SIR2-like domain